MLPYLWPQENKALRWRMALVLVVLVAGELATLSVPIVYSKVVDRFVHPNSLAMAPALLILCYGLVRLVSGALTNLRDSLFAPVRFRVARQAAYRSFAHMHKLSLRFHLDRRTGGVTRAIERGTEAVETLLRMLMSLSPTILQALLVMGVIWRLFNWTYVLMIALMITAYIVFTVRFTSWRLGIRRRMNDTNTEASGRALDSLLNYETVKYFGNEEHEARRYDNAQARYEKAAMKTQYSLGVLNFGQAAIIAISLAAIMLLGGHDVEVGRITVGEFVMVNTYLLQLYGPLNFLGSVYSGIRTALVDLEHMLSLTEEVVEVADPASPLPIATRLADSAPAQVAFRDVHFGYRPEREILHGVSFDVQPGHKVAIVGSTGAGKSTISRLLFRFYDTWSGAVLVDGHDVRSYRQADLRAAIGVVPQDTVLFNDSIGYNIAYGRLGATPEQVEEAARLAQIHDFIMTLPEGYETQVGERGLKLSGGEKQRVAIARTILKDPRVLVLDEATSALDTHTEKEIQAALKTVSAHRTTLVIAHRLSTVVDADEILVMGQGLVVERGTHAQLLAAQGQYAAMWAAQATGEG
ncbi:MAG: ABC transporter ATP-binding protein/permease [Acetobacter fabarum]|uniref:ABCB family ABC transporter ATP-binding protein/permease n=1 Tax=Acetobacter fabarum TaxID=483199 RepID=UPI00242D1C30|nr:ABC transporter ATP-binding protein/permease [Acetobacter fabarum]MCH4026307.1 ABC transporter ATP-binding protein/permease [Acetobacter fabarum]MCH4055303.1 ABC transporter ATP-binding protein/permease [Acetobacter fabarum]MCH4085831.1 ABC transporter ATP-binding protein/permease [Acetobacter fabarum]MCH4127577.1 ABC transporter ATP-binding protein/permease [Acetobacter fabarum]MCH4136926.1 ABC transporter ATP-binding protein/permease [Acetobacter fabarum]